MAILTTSNTIYQIAEYRPIFAR